MAIMGRGRRFPKPTPFIIAEALTYGLELPMIEINPNYAFEHGVAVTARSIDKLSMEFLTFREPLVRSLNFVVVPSIIKNFAAQGRPPWKKLSKKTIYNRLIEGYPRGPILDKSGRLKRGATRKNIWDVRNSELKLRVSYFTQKIPYARFHQFGAREPGTRMAQRLETHIRRFDRPTPGPFGIGELPPGVRAGPVIDVSSVQSGRGFGKLPPRPFIQLTLEEEVEIYSIFFTWLSERVDKHWGRDNI